MILLCLSGEQPIPNLIPVRYLKPDQTLIAHTTAEHSQKSAVRLSRLAGNTRLFSIGEGYQIPRILEVLHREISQSEEVIVNLTGGTKPMALAAFELARQRRYPVVYYQTEGPRGRDQKSLLYRYCFDEQGELRLEEGYPCELPALITLDDYLKAHLEGYEEKPPAGTSGEVLENVVARALKPHVDEMKQRVVPAGVKDQAEIDLLVRCGNHVGVFEIKTGGSESGKHAVDQLTTIAAREYLGTYAARFMVTQASMEDRYKALANALRVRVIELREYQFGRPLSQKDQNTLLQTVLQSIPLH